MAASTQVRLHDITKNNLDLKIILINDKRRKAGKKPVTMDDVIYHAIMSMKIEEIVKK